MKDKSWFLKINYPFNKCSIHNLVSSQQMIKKVQFMSFPPLSKWFLLLQLQVGSENSWLIGNSLYFYIFFFLSDQFSELNTKNLNDKHRTLVKVVSFQQWFHIFLGQSPMPSIGSKDTGKGCEIWHYTYSSSCLKVSKSYSNKSILCISCNYCVPWDSIWLKCFVK